MAIPCWNLSEAVKVTTTFATAERLVARTEIVPVNQTADFSQVAVGKVGRRQSPTKDDRDVMFAVGRHRLYYKER